MKIIKGKLPHAKKFALYGPEGIGKSTFASQFPEPIFIDTEGSTKELNVSRFEKPASWSMLLEQIKYVHDNPQICKTLVIDTVDWAEQMCIEHICAKHQKDGLESFGYGSGYIYVREEFGRFLNRLEEIVEHVVNVVLVAHAQLRKFEQPDEMGAYDRWELKLGKKTASQISPLVKEWSDVLLFANYKTYSIAVDDKGKKHKAQGGRRVMYTSHHPCWDAKNRYGLPEEVPFEYEQIAHIIEAGADQSVIRPDQSITDPGQSVTAPTQPITREPLPEPEQMRLPVENRPMADDKSKQAAEDNKDSALYIDERIPKNLRDLMIAHTVMEDEIQRVCEAKGYVPLGTPLYEYDTVNPGIVDGLLVASWEQVKAAVMSMRETESIPFN